MSRARDLSKLSSPSNFTVDANNNIGINSTSPDAKLDVIGIVSATSFFGDGSGLTGVANTAIISADQINVTGIVTATQFSGNITGVAATFTGNVSIGGTLTYEDVKNVDSVGLITARTGIKVLAGGINAVGVVTATSFSGSGQNLTNLPASGDSNDITACLFI